MEKLKWQESFHVRAVSLRQFSSAPHHAAPFSGVRESSEGRGRLCVRRTRSEYKRRRRLSVSVSVQKGIRKDVPGGGRPGAAAAVPLAFRASDVAAGVQPGSGVLTVRRVQVRGAQELPGEYRAGDLRLLLHVRPAEERELRGSLRAAWSMRQGTALCDPPPAQWRLHHRVRSGGLRR